jgi:hypothetical protein
MGSAKHCKKWLKIQCVTPESWQVYIYALFVCLFVCLSLLSCWRNQTDKIYFCQTYLFWKAMFFSGIDFMSEYFPFNWFNFLQTKFYLWQQNKFSTVMSRIQNKSFKYNLTAFYIKPTNLAALQSYTKISCSSHNGFTI